MAEKEEGGGGSKRGKKAHTKKAHKKKKHREHFTVMGPNDLRCRVDVLGTIVLNADNVGLNVLRSRDDIIIRDKAL